MGTDSFELLPGTVDLWLVPATAPAAAWAGCLSPEENESLLRLHFEAGARREAASRGARRHLLGRYLGVKPQRLRFERGEFGKPALAGPCLGQPLEFSASDSGDFALIAVAQGGRVGADLEQWRRIEGTDIANRFFAPGERDDLAALPAERREEAFFSLWTMKEAYVKALGRGLSKPLDSFRIAAGAGEAAELVECRDDAKAAGRWAVWRVPAPPGYCAALAAERPLQSYRLRTLDGPPGCA